MSSDRKYGRNKASATRYRTEKRRETNKARKLARHLRAAAKKAGRNVSAGTPGCPVLQRVRAPERVYYTGVVRKQHWPLYVVYAAGVCVDLTDSHSEADGAFAKVRTPPRSVIRIDYPGAKGVELQGDYVYSS